MFFLKLSGRAYPLKEGENSLGRKPGSDVVVDYPKISSSHLRLIVNKQSIHLEDLNSSNGTFVQGKRINAVEIKPGEIFLVADLEAVISEGRAAKSDSADLKKKIHERLLERMNLKQVDINKYKDAELKEETEKKVREIIDDISGDLSADIDRENLIREILQDSLGLGAIEDLLDDPSVTEVMVNKPDQIYVERSGKIVLSDKKFTSNRQVMEIIERIVTPLGRRVDESSPMVDARLKDGSRVNAIIPPLALKGPCLTIRKFSKKKLVPQDLINYGSVTEPILEFLELAVKHHKNIVISGGTGSGKTTLLNIMSSFIPGDERIVTMEDSAELQLPQEHVVSLESRPPNIEGTGAVTIRDLVKNALRMRPDRIVVGECRGGEALDMLQAMNTGHDGSLTTAHANAPRDALSRLETMCLMSGTDMPLRAIREQVCSAVNLIIQQSRVSDGSRKITYVTEVIGMDGDKIKLQDIFLFKQKGLDPEGKVLGSFVATGTIPDFVRELQEKGIPVDVGMFKQA